MADSRGNNPILYLLVGLAVAILLVVTNPTAKAHREAIAGELRAERPLAGAVGLGALGAQLPEYRSAVLCSYTISGDELVSIGALGMVWVTDIEVD
ncbi:MAG: hypothetical protein ACR2QM_14160 [Longimicrobiales bacterium]